MNAREDNQEQALSLPAICINWWNRFHEDRGAMARIRRCYEVEAVYAEPEFMSLLHMVPNRGSSDRQRDRLAAACMVLAHVRTDMREVRFGTQLGRTLSSSAAGQSRFRKLYEVPDESVGDLAAHLIRFIRRLKGSASVGDLARVVLFWGKVRKQVAMDFFDNFKK